MDRGRRGDPSVEAFAQDGVVVCARGADRRRGRRARPTAIETVLAAPSPLAQVASGDDDPGRFFEDFCRWTEVDAIGRLARDSRVPAIAAALMATPRVRLYHDHVLVKEGGTAQRTPWHQDQPYYNVDGRGVSAWIPVDPVPAAGSLELLAGSHAGPWLMPAHLPHRRGALVPRGQPRRAARHRGRPRRLRPPALRAPAGRRGLLRLPHRARRSGGSRSPAAGGCSRCATCRTRPGTRRGAGARRRRSRAWPTSCPTARSWTTRCSRWCGRAERQCAVAAGWTSSTRTPPASLGCTKLTRLSAVPRLGAS